MKRKKGTTLVEAIITIVIVSVVVVTFLQALGLGIFGTLDISRKTSALNLAKSQVENVSAQAYNPSIGTGNLSNVYGLITANGSDIEDKLNYNISGHVSYVDANTSLQKITVNVSYLAGKQVQLTGYKADPDAFNPSPHNQPMLVTYALEAAPALPAGSGCPPAVGCPTDAKMFSGTYLTFYTSGGYISATWRLRWVRNENGAASIGSPFMGIYGPGKQIWANSSNSFEESGTIHRCQTTGLIGNIPGCSTAYCSAETNQQYPVEWTPYNVLGTGLPCEGCLPFGSICDEVFWAYDYSLSVNSGIIEDTITTYVSAGVYTLLLFNGENKIDLETISATVTCWK